jgi:hypothetical protein
VSFSEPLARFGVVFLDKDKPAFGVEEQALLIEQWSTPGCRHPESGIDAVQINGRFNAKPCLFPQKFDVAQYIIAAFNDSKLSDEEFTGINVLQVAPPSLSTNRSLQDMRE